MEQNWGPRAEWLGCYLEACEESLKCLKATRLYRISRSMTRLIRLDLPGALAAYCFRYESSKFYPVSRLRPLTPQVAGPVQAESGRAIASIVDCLTEAELFKNSWLYKLPAALKTLARGGAWSGTLKQLFRRERRFVGILDLDLARRIEPLGLPQPTDEKTVETPLIFAAPNWLEEMLAYEKGVNCRSAQQLDAAPSARALVACLGGGRVSLPDCRSLSEAQKVAWIIGDEPLAPEEQEFLQNCARVFTKAELPPAVQPKLHNPIGHWSGGDGVQSLHEQALPADWRRLVEDARARPRHRALLSELRRVPPDFVGDLRRHLLSQRTRQEACLAVRVAQIEVALGLSVAKPWQRNVKASALLATCRPEFLDNAVHSFLSQSYPEKELILGCHGFALTAETKKILGKVPSGSLKVSFFPREFSLGLVLRTLSEQIAGNYVWKLDDDDQYHPFFLQDSIDLLNLSDAGLVGKSSFALHSLNDNRRFMFHSTHEYEYMLTSLFGGTMVMHRFIAERIPWPAVPVGVDVSFAVECVKRGVPILNGHRYYYRMLRRESTAHTWFNAQNELERNAVQGELSEEEVCNYFLLPPIDGTLKRLGLG